MLFEVDMTFTLDDIDLQKTLTLEQALMEYVVHFWNYEILFLWPWSNDQGVELLVTNQTYVDVEFRILCNVHWRIYSSRYLDTLLHMDFWMSIGRIDLQNNWHWMTIENLSTMRTKLVTWPVGRAHVSVINCWLYSSNSKCHYAILTRRKRE